VKLWRIYALVPSPDSISHITVHHNGALAGEPYFNAQVDVDGDETYDLLDLDTGCIDLANVIFSDTPYCALLVLSYDIDKLGTLTGIIDQDDLDKVDYCMS
jgi:hypothetical protein